MQEARDLFASAVLVRLARGERLGAPSDFASGNTVIRVFPLEGRSAGPPEVVTKLSPAPAMLMLTRELGDPDVGARYEKTIFRYLAIAVPLFGVLGLGVLVLFGVLLFRRRLGFRIGAGLGLLALAAMLLSGAFFDLGGQRGFGAGVLAAFRLLGVVVLAGYWAVAEALLRDSLPGFRTSLDALAAGRLSPRLGRALLGGLGLGAAVAGARLLFASGVAAAGVPGVVPQTPSFALPLFGGLANAFLEGPYAAATSSSPRRSCATSSAASGPTPSVPPRSPSSPPCPSPTSRGARSSS